MRIEDDYTVGDLVDEIDDWIEEGYVDGDVLKRLEKYVERPDQSDQTSAGQSDSPTSVYVSSVSSVGSGSRQVPQPLSASHAFAVEYSQGPHHDIGVVPVLCPSGNIRLEYSSFFS